MTLGGLLEEKKKKVAVRGDKVGQTFGFGWHLCNLNRPTKLGRDPPGTNATARAIYASREMHEFENYMGME
jgi:hypothetical protein